MRYQLEFVRDSESLKIHLDRRLHDEDVLMFGPECQTCGTGNTLVEAHDPEALEGFARAVTALNGMEIDVYFGRHDIQLEKALLFSWDDLLPHILGALEMFIAKDTALVKAGDNLYSDASDVRHHGIDVDVDDDD